MKKKAIKPVAKPVVTTSTTFSGKTALAASAALNRFLSGYVVTVVSVSAYYNAVRQEHIILLVYRYFDE